MNSSHEICPICDEGNLIPTSHGLNLSYKNDSRVVNGFLHSKCDCCGAVITNNEQTRHNKRLVTAYHKQVDGLLTGEEVRVIRKKYGLTQSKAAKIFGGGPVAFSKYESDDVVQSEAMDKLLRMASYSEDIFSRLAEISGIEIHRQGKEVSGWNFNLTDVHIAPQIWHWVNVSHRLSVANHATFTETTAVIEKQRVA